MSEQVVKRAGTPHHAAGEFIHRAARHLAGGLARPAKLGGQARRLKGGVALAAMMLVLAGCRPAAPPNGGQSVQSPPPPKSARSEVDRGPVRVTVEVHPAQARLSDEPQLTLTISHEPGVTVRKPPFGEALGDFILRDFREPLPRVEGEREVLQQVYTLEPTRTGKLSIAPISVTFLDQRPGQDGKEQTLTTDSLTVEIASVLDTDIPSLDKLRPSAGPIELPPEPGAGRWLVPLVVLGTLGAGALAWLWRRSRHKAVEPPPPEPRELAQLELERLLQSRLADHDVKQFYVELTGIVRRFIERTTAVRAPEQTTEEFLREIGRQQMFPEDDRRRLAEFLESADLVKFAAHQPRREDIDESVRRARAFLLLETDEVAV